MNRLRFEETNSAEKIRRDLGIDLRDLDCLASLMDCDMTEEPPADVLHQVIELFSLRLTTQLT